MKGFTKFFIFKNYISKTVVNRLNYIDNQLLVSIALNSDNLIYNNDYKGNVQLITALIKQF